MKWPLQSTHMLTFIFSNGKCNKAQYLEIDPRYWPWAVQIANRRSNCRKWDWSTTPTEKRHYQRTRKSWNIVSAPPQSWNRKLGSCSTNFIPYTHANLKSLLSKTAFYIYRSLLYKTVGSGLIDLKQGHFVAGKFCRGEILSGLLCRRGILSWGCFVGVILSRVILSWGYFDGVISSGLYCPGLFLGIPKHGILLWFSNSINQN